MKHVFPIVALVVLLASSRSFAQSDYRIPLQKGSWLANGSLAFSLGTSRSRNLSSSSEFEEAYLSFTGSPKAGIFLIDGVMLGLSTELSVATYKEESIDSKTKTTQYTLGPFFRYYSSAGVFFHADIAVGKGIYDDGEPNRQDGKTFKWQVGGGYAIFLNDHIAIEPTFVYQYSSTETEVAWGTYEASHGEFVLGVGLSMFLH